MANEDTALHTKYRPRTLDDVVGNASIVAQLKGIIAKKKFPSAIAFFGQSSAGKTTLARAFASSVLGKPCTGSGDYVELNAGSSKSIDDIRQLADLARLRPSGGIRRLVMVDEAQSILTNPHAATCLAGHTLVQTDRGPITAKELHAIVQSGEPIKVASFNHTLQSYEWKTVVASCVKTSTAPRINANGSELTADHRAFSVEQQAYMPVASLVGEVTTGISLHDGAMTR